MEAGCGNDGLWKARKTMVLFSALPTNLGNRSSRFPHSHCHDYDGDEISPKTSRLRDTHSEGKVKPVSEEYEPSIYFCNERDLSSEHSTHDA
jgi:hypothetical protein